MGALMRSGGATTRAEPHGARWRTWPLGLALLAACAGGPPPDTVSPARDAAVRFALAERSFAVNLAKQCRYDPASKLDLSPLAAAALRAWEERNQPTVSAARGYIADYLEVFARRSGRRAAADRERELAAEQTADGARAALRAIEEAGGRESCPLLLDQLGEGALDFADPSLDPVLAELRERYLPAASAGAR